MTGELRLWCAGSAAIAPILRRGRQERWLTLVDEHGLRLREMREPVHPGTGRPASVPFAVPGAAE